MMSNDFLRKIGKQVFGAPGLSGPQGPLGAEGAPNPKIMKNAFFRTLDDAKQLFEKNWEKKVFWGPRRAEGAPDPKIMKNTFFWTFDDV